MRIAPDCVIFLDISVEAASEVKYSNLFHVLGFMGVLNTISERRLWRGEV